jgi:hypothetical protein
MTERGRLSADVLGARLAGEAVDRGLAHQRIDPRLRVEGEKFAGGAGALGRHRAVLSRSPAAADCRLGTNVEKPLGR